MKIADATFPLPRRRRRFRDLGQVLLALAATFGVAPKVYDNNVSGVKDSSDDKVDPTPIPLLRKNAPIPKENATIIIKTMEKEMREYKESEAKSGARNQERGPKIEFEERTASGGARGGNEKKFNEEKFKDEKTTGESAQEPASEPLTTLRHEQVSPEPTVVNPPALQAPTEPILTTTVRHLFAAPQAQLPSEHGTQEQGSNIFFIIKIIGITTGGNVVLLLIVLGLMKGRGTEIRGIWYFDHGPPPPPPGGDEIERIKTQAAIDVARAQDRAIEVMVQALALTEQTERIATATEFQAQALELAQRFIRDQLYIEEADVAVLTAQIRQLEVNAQESTSTVIALRTALTEERSAHQGTIAEVKQLRAVCEEADMRAAQAEDRGKEIFHQALKSTEESGNRAEDAARCALALEVQTLELLEEAKRSEIKELFQAQAMSLAVDIVRTEAEAQRARALFSESQARQQVKEAEARAAQAEGKVHELETAESAELEKTKARLDAALERATLAEEAKRTAEEGVKDKERKAEEEAELKMRLKQEIADMKSIIDNFQKEADRLKGDVRYVEEGKRKLEQLVKDLEKKNLDLNRMLENAKQELGKMQEELTLLHARYAALEGRNTNLHDRIRELDSNEKQLIDQHVADVAKMDSIIAEGREMCRERDEFIRRLKAAESVDEVHVILGGVATPRSVIGDGSIAAMTPRVDYVEPTGASPAAPEVAEYVMTDSAPPPACVPRLDLARGLFPGAAAPAPAPGAVANQVTIAYCAVRYDNPLLNSPHAHHLLSRAAKLKMTDEVLKIALDNKDILSQESIVKMVLDRIEAHENQNHVVNGYNAFVELFSSLGSNFAQFSTGLIDQLSNLANKVLDTVKDPTLVLVWMYQLFDDGDFINTAVVAVPLFRGGHGEPDDDDFSSGGVNANPDSTPEIPVIIGTAPSNGTTTYTV